MTMPDWSAMTDDELNAAGVSRDAEVARRKLAAGLAIKADALVAEYVKAGGDCADVVAAVTEAADNPPAPLEETPDTKAQP